MSFPGYLKSLNLINKHDYESGCTPGSQEEGEIVIPDQDVSRAASDHHRSPRPFSRSMQRVEDIIDEKGNGPTKSLWVGNIPPRTTSSGLRALFTRFGLIISTKPMAKYAFVNFEKLESAIAAFEAFHDRDIFETGCSTINIRFTGSQAESKQTKDDVWERTNSMNIKGQAVQKQYFQSIDLKNDTPTHAPPLEPEWPNGKPPTGPKFQRNDISPPPLRRSDCYRPAEIPSSSSHRSESDLRRSDLETKRGRTYRRHSNQHYSPEYSPRSCRSIYRSRSSRSTSSELRHTEMASPLPWDRGYGQLRRPEPIEMNNRKGHRVERADSIPDHQECLRETSVVRTVSEVPRSHSSGLLHDKSTEPRERLSALLPPTFNVNQQAKSPSLRPLDRLRIERDEGSGSSVASEIATNSSRTSMKRKRCHDCKKPANDLSPLTSCSKCTRRYHSGCGDPKPSSCSDRSTFVCRKCQIAKEVETSLSKNSTTRQTLSKLDRKVQLASPPLSFSHDGNGSLEHSPHNESPLLSHEHNLKSFFPTRVDDLERDRSIASIEAAHESGNRLPESTFSAAQHSQPHCLELPSSRPASRQFSNKEFWLKNKYKVVTCKWWASGSCTQTEEGCYYTHNHTSVSFPDRKKVDKAWTCYDWLNHKCSLPEVSCLHAHQDTGLHTWKDGRPSFKHVTCFWWSRGRCKWDEEFCKFAHTDTGLYSLDPSETWQGGSKFSMVHPREGAGNSDLPRRPTSSTVASTIRPLDETALSEDNSATDSLATTLEHNRMTAVMKPSLTIDTSPNLSLTEQRHLPTGLRLSQSTIGAPPQTPNGDSPNKIYNRGFNEPKTRHFVERVSDLPTPDFDEAAEHEPESDGQVVSHKDVSKAFAWERTAAQWKSGTDGDANTKTRMHISRADLSKPLPSPNTEQSRSTTSVSSSEAENNAISRDPRLQRQTRMVEPFLTTNADGMVSPDRNFEACDITSAAVKLGDDLKSSNNDDIARPSVKRCQKCQKSVFGTALCRGCSSAHDSNAETSPSQSRQPETVILPSEPGIQILSTVTSTPNEDLKSTVTHKPSAIVPRPSATSLKRSAEGSNMFLKNKRPKNSIFSSSNSIRSDAFRRPSHESRVRVKVPRIQDRREPRPTLNDLLLEERAKNQNKKNNDDTILDTQIVESPIEEAEKEERVVGRHDPQLFARPRDEVDALYKGRLTHKTVVEDDSTFGVNSRISSSPSACSPQPPSPMAQALIATDTQPQTRLPLEEVHSPERSPFTKQHLQGPQSPDIPPIQIDTLSNNPVDSWQSPRGISESHGSASSETSREADVSARVQSRPIYGTMIKPGHFSWASAITCRQCQLKHKKCLHNDSGKLCAVRCREYVLSRKGRPDTGRSRNEWNSILEASELDGESDQEPLVDDTGSESPLNSTSSESEDDFATALDGDEMMLDHVDDHITLLQKFQKVATPTSPRKTQIKSPTAVTRFFVRDSDEEDEEEFVEPAMVFRAPKVRMNGVMFESDSEDEDYLSDEDVVPPQPDLPIDPLHVPPKCSRNLFEIAPELSHKVLIQQLEIRNASQPRLPRKQQWSELRDRQFRERRERFGNPHWEVSRTHVDINVTALVERIVASPHMEDAFGTVQTREENIGFSDFLGMPKMPEICLMNDGDTLGFRDGQKDRDRAFGRTGRGLGKRECDDEKWPVRMK